MTGRECDHTRGTEHERSTAITVCHHCHDYVCSICGRTIEAHKGLYVTSPIVQWRYCSQTACVEAEAVYHGCSVAVMVRHRSALVAKRVLLHLQDRGIEPRPPHVPPARATLVKFTPQPFTLAPGEACWCNRGKDCDGGHEIGPIEVVNVCGICGQTFRIADDDPHYSTGRGPICPDDTRLP